MNPAAPPVQASDGSRLEPVVLDLVAEVARELHPRTAPSGIGLDSSLEREVGLDSLGRVELLQRLEERLGIQVPEEVALAVDTPRDLLAAARAGQPGAVRVAPLAPTPAPTDGLPARATTLLDVLEHLEERHGERPWLHLLRDPQPPLRLTYAQLAGQARAVAAGMVARGVGPRDSVALMLPTGGDFFACFWGALLAGAVPVPIYPPHRPEQLEEHLRRQVAVLRNAQARLLVTVPAGRRLSGALRGHVPGLQAVVTRDDLLGAGEASPRPLVRGHDVALLQYTSGSTGEPKGVVLTHANLLANMRAMGEAIEAGPEDTFVSWLPLYHDMGLIGASLATAYHLCQLVLMSPLAFIARPRRWLWAIHQARGTISAAPNFAYELCAAKLRDAELEGLDLSCWRVAFNGAEPVRPDTVRRFLARLEPYGLRPEAMLPVYGLAEAGLGVTFPPLGRPPRVDAVDRDVFQRQQRAAPARGSAPALEWISCGQPLPGYAVRVVDARGRPLGERQVGRLWFRGPSATSGYRDNPSATAELHHDGWLDTGDHAYLAGGELFVTGRVKDLLIKAGRNVYPEELEQAVGELEGVRPGCVAAFASADPASRIEQLVVVAETRRRDPAALQALRADVVEAAQAVLGAPPDDVVLAAPHTVRKTSSGKVRRSACRELYERGELGRRRAVWWQVTRLFASGLALRLAGVTGRAALLAYRAWFWTVVAVLTAGLYLGLLLLPRLRWREVWGQGLVRLALHALGFSLHKEGLEHLTLERPAVVVANHASFLDPFALALVLPRRAVFVAKGELLGNPFTRFLVRRLDLLTVDRFDARGGVADIEQVAAALRAGRSPVFFAEGTFVPAPGLREFRLGAFVLAAREQVPVVPVALCGTREALRGREWAPRPGRGSISAAPPIAPQGAGWSEALRLRDAARAAILARCGEPDLAQEPIAPRRR